MKTSTPIRAEILVQPRGNPCRGSYRVRPLSNAKGTAFATLHEFVGCDGSLPTINLVSDSVISTA
jgi:hypothetical protein